MTDSFVRRLANLAAAARAARSLAGHDAWSRDELEAHQRRVLSSLLRHCIARSPYYARALKDRGLDACAPLSALPVLDKASLLGHFDAIVTDPRLKRADLESHVDGPSAHELYLGDYHVLCSGGTSGRRGLFAFGRHDWADILGGLLRVNAFMGVQPRLPRRRRLAAVAATTPLHMTSRMGATIDVGVHALLRLDARSPIEELVSRLNNFRPEALMAYPSVAALLADEQMAGRLRIAPGIVATTSEVRTEDMEARIVAAWGSAPFNNYASTETGCLAIDCDRHHGMHLLTDQTLVEVVDEFDRPVPSGTPGHHLLVTSLVNRTLPILRYRLDDLVTLSPEPCPCGRPFPLVVGLDGRSDDLLRLPAHGGGTVVVHPLALRSPLAQVRGLQQYRIVHERNRLSVETVATDANVPAEVERRLRAALAAQRVGAVEVEVRRVADIARHATTGKFKLIESR